jgi:hypothetical protein
MNAGLSRALATVALATTAGACAMIDRMDGVREAKALQRTGEAAEAIVVEISDTGITVNQDPVVRLVVDVQPQNRPAYRATIPKSLISRVHVPQFQPGSRVPVRIDRKDPMRVALAAYTYR